MGREVYTWKYEVDVMSTVVFAVYAEQVFCVRFVSYFTTQNKACLRSIQSKKWCLSVRGEKKKATSNDSRAGGLLAF